MSLCRGPPVVKVDHDRMTVEVEEEQESDDSGTTVTAPVHEFSCDLSSRTEQQTRRFQD